MKILYLDCFSGISGDMLLGVFIALGCPVSVFQEVFNKLPIPPVRIDVKSIMKSGISARKLTFIFDASDKTHRPYGEIRRILNQASIGETIRKGALDIFEALAEAESKIHGTEKDKVHFHEAGGLDAICDVVGAVAARNALKIEKVFASSLPFGQGEIECAHGILPNPAPATLELLKGFETHSLPDAMEFVTPTGAAILKTWVDPGQPVSPYRIHSIGYGAGDRELPGRPNVLRGILGKAVEKTSGDEVLLLETDVDDETPELLAYVFKELFSRGALDVTMHGVIMKKGRLGTRITVVSPVEKRGILADTLLRETSTLGVRILPVTRRTLPRDVVEITTSLGKATVKVAVLPNGEKRISPEYEACATLARRHGLPLRRVMDHVRDEAENQLLSESL